jgi:hypothetical protein
MREKAGSTGALRENNFTPARSRCGPDFTSSEQRVEASHSF